MKLHRGKQTIQLVQMFAKHSFILNYFCHKLQYNANRKEVLLIFSIFIIGLPKLAFFAVKAVLQFIQLFSILICCGSQCTHFLVQVFKQLLYGTGNKRSRKDQVNKSSDWIKRLLLKAAIWLIWVSRTL